MSQTVRKILMIRPSALGDVARTVPVLVSLRKAYPNAKIDWLVRKEFADVVAHHPALHEVIPFERKQMKAWWWNPKVTGRTISFLRDLKKRKYDAVFDLQGLGRSGFFSRITCAKQRVGPADARELGWLAYNRKIKIDPMLTHTVDRMLAVIGGYGVNPVRDMTLYVGTEDRHWADRFLIQHNLDEHPYAVIAPTARWLCKCWPIDKFSQLADRLPNMGIKTAIIVASGNEKEMVAPLFEKVKNIQLIDLVGRTTVGHLLAILEQSKLVLCNDSAALHMAIGLGRRAVSIFGPTDPDKVGPYRYDRAVVRTTTKGNLRYRSVNDQSLIGKVTEEMVWQTVEKVMTSPQPNLIHE